MSDTNTPWRELERTTVFSKFGRSVDRVDFELPDGRNGQFFLKNERAAAAVLALTPDRRVILARQYRPGPARMLYDLPGGLLEPGEDAQAAITRELFEETGYQGEIRPAGRYWLDAYSNARRYAFYATDCIKISEPQPEQNEFIDVATLPLDEFRTTILRHGELTDAAAAYLALDALRLL